MRILLLIIFSFYSLYSGELSPVDDLSITLADMNFNQNQVDQLSGLLGNLSMQTAPQTTELIALLIKTMAYDSQSKSNGLAMTTLINCHLKKLEGQEIDVEDQANFSENLQTGEPTIPFKKISEEMLFALMTRGMKSLESNWKETAGEDQIAVFDQLQAWRQTPCNYFGFLLPNLPLEYMFSDTATLESH